MQAEEVEVEDMVEGDEGAAGEAGAVVEAEAAEVGAVKVEGEDPKAE